MVNTRNLITAFAFVALAFPAVAQDSFPTPPANWWTGLQAEDGSYPSCSFDMQASGMSISMELSITKIEGSQITFTTKSKFGDMDMPAQEQTMDAAGSELQGGSAALPEGATCTKTGEETVKVGDVDYACTIYEIEYQGSKTKLWYCPKLPMVFSGGNVKIESEAAGQKSVITLKSYKGKHVAIGG